MPFFIHVITANDVTNFPSTIDNTNGDGSTTSGTATIETDRIAVSLITMEANNRGNSTFTLVFLLTGVVQSVTYGYQSPVTEYGITIESGTQNAIFTINGENVLTISMLSIREVASCDVISYEPPPNTTISLRVPGIPSQFQRESISEYRYIDPVFGRAYEFTNNKVTFETGAGILFVNTVTNVAVFSQQSSASELILRYVSRTFRVEVIDNSLSLRLQLSQIFPLSGTIEIEHMNEIIYYTGGSLVTNTTSVAANNLIVFGNNGFEAIDSTGETVIPIYSDIYFNPVNSEIFVSTNSMFSDLISGLLEFLQSNTPQDGVFMVSGQYVTYQGVNIIRLTNMTTTSVFSPPTILYSGNSLFGSQTIDDVFFVMFQSGGEITVSASSSEAPIFYFTAARIYISEGRALVTDSSQTQTLVADALNDILNPLPTTTTAAPTTTPVPTATPVFPVIPPDLVTCRPIRIERRISVVCMFNVGISFERLILKIIFPVSFITFNTEETIMYNDGTLSFSSTTIPNVTNVTVVNGEGVLLLSPPLTGYSKDIDSSYILYSNEGLAVLTNQTDLINLIDSSNTFVSIVTLECQQFLYIGDLQVIRLNNIRRIELNSSQQIIAVTPEGIVISAEGRVLFNEAVDKFVVYRNSEAIPLEMFMMGQPILGPGSFYVNEADSCAFYTDRLDIINAIENVNQTLVVRSRIIGGETVLNIGKEDIIQLTGSRRFVVTSNQRIEYSGNTIIVRDITTNEIIEMFTNITSSYRYSQSNDIPELDTGGGITVVGPITIIISNDTTLITDRSEVLNVVDPILTPVTPVFPVIPRDLVICRLIRIERCIYVLCIYNFGIPFKLLILKIIFPVSFITFNTEETIMYNDVTLSYSSTTIPNVTNVTVVNGEGVVRLSPPLTGYSKDIDSSYILYSNEGLAVLTNQTDLINLIDSSNTFVSIVTLECQQFLYIGDLQVIRLNNIRRIELNSSQQIIAVTPEGIVISAEGRVLFNEAVDKFVVYRNSEAIPLEMFMMGQPIFGPGSFYVNEADSCAFYTDRLDIINAIENVSQPLVVCIRIIGGETVLNIGYEDIIQLTGSMRFVVTSNQRIEYSGNTIIIRDITTNEIIETFTNITSSYRYLQSNDIPELDTGGGITVVGPSTIIISNDTTLITDRSEVLNVVDPIIPPPFPPSQMFRIEERSDGSFVLVINEMDIITISDAMKQIVESTEQLSYSSNTITITNFISSDELNRILATTLVIYRNTDVEPLNFTGNAPNVYNGPFTLCYTPDGVAFFTNRQDIVMLICDTLNNITTPPPTTATTTPTPDIFPSPQTIIIINSDGSRWFTGQFSSVRT